jgi:hypothetical protein
MTGAVSAQTITLGSECSVYADRTMAPRRVARPVFVQGAAQKPNLADLQAAAAVASDTTTAARSVTSPPLARSPGESA